MESHFTYVDNVNSNLICCICRMPFVKPMTTTTCSHTFCNDCIVAAISISPQCPVDRSPLGEADLQPANPIVRSLVDELTVECTNRLHGCLHTCQRQLLSGHLRDLCEYVQVPCNEKECEENLLRKDAKEHSSVCKHRSIVCRGCGKPVQMLYIDEHHGNCSTLDFPCSYCDVMYPLSKIDQHEVTCPEMTVSCNHTSHGCPWSGTKRTLLNHINECPYESIKGFFSLNTLRISRLEAENSVLWNRIEESENTLRIIKQDMESTKVVLGPWFTQDGRSNAVRPSSPIEPAPRAHARRSSNAINSAMFGLSPESGLLPLESFTSNTSSNVSPFEPDPLSYFFPTSNNIFDGSPNQVTEGTYRQLLSSSVAPLNLNTSLMGSLSSLRSSLVTLASSFDSEVRRHDVALVAESSRFNEEVMALRAVVHGLRMQVHQIMMDRNSQVTGRTDDAVGLGYSHLQLNQSGEFIPYSRYQKYGPTLTYRSNNVGTNSYIQTTKL